MTYRLESTLWSDGDNKGLHINIVVEKKQELNVTRIVGIVREQ